MNMNKVVVFLALFAALIALGGIIDNLLPPKNVNAASQFANIICDNWRPVSTSANLQLITAGNANQFIYVCGYQLSNGNAAAQSFSVVEGTGATCGTGTASMVGTTAAANGVTLALGGGTVNYGSGAGAVAKTAVAGDNVCILVSGGPISGVIAWTAGPF